MIGRKLVDHDGQFLFGQGPQIEVKQQVLGRILLGQEGIKEIHLGTRRPVLLSRGKQIEALLVHHGLLLVLSLQPVTDGLVQGSRFFLDLESM